MPDRFRGRRHLVLRVRARLVVRTYRLIQGLHHGIVTVERGPAVLEALIGEVYGVPVVSGEEEKPDYLRLVRIQYLFYGEKITERLGHLLPVDVNKAVMHPVAYELFPGCSLG